MCGPLVDIKPDWEVELDADIMIQASVRIPFCFKFLIFCVR